MKGWTIALALIATSTGGVAWAAPDNADVDAALALQAAATAVAPNRFVWNDTATSEPVSVVVSIADQRAYVYRGQTMIAVSSVSTGKEGKGTPAGTYPILQKKQDHKSNLYDDAPMPFMQRLTWDGIALHAGRNPGFPASHGCVRMPAAFAKKLFEITTLGSTVTVMDEPFLAGDGMAPEPVPFQADETIAAARADSLQLASFEAK
jgi:lipoprotein-anchoring transpeptidase ErfK/SrfK